MRVHTTYQLFAVVHFSADCIYLFILIYCFSNFLFQSLPRLSYWLWYLLFMYFIHSHRVFPIDYPETFRELSIFAINMQCYPEINFMTKASPYSAAVFHWGFRILSAVFVITYILCRCVNECRWERLISFSFHSLSSEWFI